MQLNADMSANAQAWAEYMAANDHYDHNPNYKVGAPAGSTRFAENVAAGWGSDFYISAPNLWYNSPGHYANMMHPEHNLMGAGFAVSESGRAYAVQQFASYNYVPPAPPGMPAQPAVVSNGDGTAMLTWSYPDPGSSPVHSATITHTVNGSPFNTYTVASETSLIVHVSPGTVNSFTVSAANNAGVSPTTAEATLNEPAVAPSNVSAEPTFIGSRTATIQASAESDGGSPITKYVLVIDGQTLESADGKFELTGLTRNTTYSGAVSAVNSVGDSQKWEGELFTTQAETPTSPQNVNAKIGKNGTSVSISWTQPADNGGDQATAYEYNVTNLSDSSTVAEGVTGDTQFAFEGDKGSAYQFSVSAVNKAGASSSATSKVSIPKTVPSETSAPAAVITGDTEIVVAWEPPTDSGGAEITKYTVEGYAGSETEPSISKTVDSDTTTAIFNESDGIKHSTVYRFTVNSKNSVGESKDSSRSQPVETSAEQSEDEETVEEPELVAPETAEPVPHAQANPVASKSDSSILAEWVTPVSAENLIAFKVDVYEAANEEPFKSETVPASQTSLNIADLKPAVEYTVEVSAVYTEGVSEPVRASTVSPVIAPESPHNLSVSPQLTDGNPALSVSWERPTANGGSSLTSYTVSATNRNSADEIHVQTVEDTSAVFSNLKPATEYSISVSASNELYSSDEAKTQATTSTALPDAPSQVEITVNGEKQTLIEWGVPNDGTLDNSVGIKKYTVALFDEKLNLISPPAPFNLADWFFGLFSNDEPAPVEVETNSITWEGLESGNYFVHITAVNNSDISGRTAEKAFTVNYSEAGEPAEGEEGEPSDDSEGGAVEEEEQVESEPSATAPSSPLNLKAEITSTKDEIVVSWSHPLSDGGSPVTHYIITQTYNGSDVVREVLADTTEASYVGLVRGGEYRFTVQAVNDAGLSAGASTVQTFPKLSAPPVSEKPETPASDEELFEDNSSAPESPKPTPAPEEKPAPAENPQVEFSDTNQEPSHSSSEKAEEEPVQASETEKGTGSDSDSVRVETEAEKADIEEGVYTPAPSDEQIAMIKKMQSDRDSKENPFIMLVLLGIVVVVLGGGAVIAVHRSKLKS